MRCIECGEKGHLKCTSFKKSSRVKLNFNVQTNIENYMKEKSSMSDMFD